MMGSNFNDEMDCSIFFDHIDDLIDFPSDNDIGFNSSNGNDFPSIWNNNVEDLPCPDPIFSGMKNDSASDLSAELAVPYEDIVQLEWLSTFVEDSFSGGGMTLNKENVPVNNNASQNQFRTSSPVSVLESSSSSSCSDGKIVPLSPSHRGPQRARSKRPRPANFKPRSAMPFVTPTSSVTDNSRLVNVPMISSESENFVESLRIKIPKPASENKKKQKQKPSFPSGSAEMNCSSPSQQQASIRKCLHCEITKTPQWRAGPLGPKTLCNACGVRYKSGRLFPEYRPAASPTFVPSLHSNSHKKVVEMRIKGGGEKRFMNAIVPPISSEPEMIPNASLEYM